MARRRRRNASGIVEWAKAHPWMTFFIVGSALAIPVQLYELSVLAKQAKALPPPDPLAQPTPPPQPKSVPQDLGGGIVFVPGVIDPATGQA